jgi:regulator of protease activity HflC (stomatin/prohibitin superfamily)
MSNAPISNLGARLRGVSIFGVGVVVVGLLALLGTFTQVNAGEVGVVKHFGAINEDSPLVFQPGIHVKVPFRDEVVIFDTRIQKEEVESSAASKDGVTISSTITVNYHIEPAKAPLILQNVGANYRERIIDQQIQQAFKDVTAQYAGLELIQKREDVALRAKDVLKEKLAPYYIIVDEFTIPNQQNLQARQLQEKARTEAETALIVAQGQANAQRAQATTLTPEYLNLQAIQRWNGVLPQYLTPNTPLPFVGSSALNPAASAPAAPVR